MGEAAGDQNVFVRERDRRPAVELADQALERQPRLAASPDPSETPEDARGATDALERAEQETVQLVVDVGERDERKVLDVMVERLVRQGQPDPEQELAELVELGRLQ